jgi:heterodisulfide reductase subunit C
LAVLQGTNKSVGEIFVLIEESENLQNKREGLNPDELQTLNEAMQNKLDEILTILHDPIALPTIVNDLKEYDVKNGTNTYETFKNSAVSIDNTLREKFDRVELESVSNIAQLKL